MKICIAQIQPDKGNIKRNMANHMKWINMAISKDADLIVFPELSLTGYEPGLAEELAIVQNDVRLDVFQKISDRHKIAIGIGMPIKSEMGIFISMVIFQSNRNRIIYNKQKLHPDELRYFVQGNEQMILDIKNKSIAPAICYESLQPGHAEKAVQLGASVYIASVAKPQNGVDKAFNHFPKIAEKYAIAILMSNSIGYCDNFESAGQTSVWDENGILMGKLSDKSEGILIFDTDTKELIKKVLS